MPTIIPIRQIGTKIQLYRDAIDSTRPRAKQNQTSEYYFTRSLNRLGQLTEEWCNEGDAFDIWNELYAYANESMDEEEKELTINEIHRNAPWFQPRTTLSRTYKLILPSDSMDGQNRDINRLLRRSNSFPRVMNN